MTTSSSIISLQYREAIRAAIDPREVACDEIVNVIIKTVGPILFEEAAKEACRSNQLVDDYIGHNLKLRDNNRLEVISKRIREYGNIAVMGIKPLRVDKTRFNRSYKTVLEIKFL